MSTVAEPFYSINSTISSALFINSKFSLCIAAHLLQQTKASSALLGTANLPKFPATMSTHLSLN
jgi:hypothetical protein